MLLEINAHSLFSKYFSESGKLVMKMFTRIKEYLDDRKSFVVVLIDEVESLTAARSGRNDKLPLTTRSSVKKEVEQKKTFKYCLSFER